VRIALISMMYRASTSKVIRISVSIEEMAMLSAMILAECNTAVEVERTSWQIMETGPEE